MAVREHPMQSLLLFPIHCDCIPLSICRLTERSSQFITERYNFLMGQILGRTQNFESDRNVAG